MSPAIFTSPVTPTPPTTVSAPVVADVDSVSISICTLSSGIIIICSRPEANPPAANTMLLLDPVSPVANTRLPAPIYIVAVPVAGAEGTSAVVFAYVNVVVVGVAKITYLPLNVAFMPTMSTVLPTENPCAA